MGTPQGIVDALIFKPGGFKPVIVQEIFIQSRWFQAMAAGGRG
jgi:hypothetical protein